MAEEKDIPTIRTMRGDAESLIKEKQVSQLDIATKAYMARGVATKTPSSFSISFSFSKILAAVLLALLLASVGYFGYRYYLSFGEKAETAKPKPPAKLLAVDDEKILRAHEATLGELVFALNSERTRPLRFGSIIYFPIEFTKRGGDAQFAVSRDLIDALSWKPPPIFSESILPEFNTLVVYSPNGGNVVLVFKAKNFERALTSLFEWERTMRADFRPFLSQEDFENISQFSWQDEVVKNNDARVLKNKLGKVILGHAIFNKQLVLISTSQDALAVVLERLIKLPLR